MKLYSTIAKLLVFTVATLGSTAVVATLISNTLGRPTATYKAQFTDVTGLLMGDDVRIAGVKVGRVDSITVQDGHALVGFELRDDIPVTSATDAAVRYRDLLGRRYLAITSAGNAQAPAVMKPGSTIVLAQTTPSLDLTVLFNGFKPLFSTLQPKDVNQLAYEIIQTLQGEGSTVDSLLQHVASLTNNLADRDQLIGSVITNLSNLADLVDQRDTQLQGLVTNLSNLATGLATDKDAIFNSLTNIDNLASKTASLVNDAHDPATTDIAALNTTLGYLSDPARLARLTQALKDLPTVPDKVLKFTSYGSFMNLYVCRISISVNGAAETEVGMTPPAQCQ